MNRHIVIFCSIFLSVSSTVTTAPIQQYDLIVVGAGPAGISAIGALLDYNKVNPKNILWIDPEFTIGRIKNYPCVPSNTQVRFFLKYFTSCKSFDHTLSNKALSPMKQLDQNKWCPLGYLIEPLQLLTDHLKTKVNSVIGMVTRIQQDKKNGWLLEINHANIIMSKRVILATGSCPKRLTLSGPQEIPLDVAFNPSELKDWIQPEDTVAIFGNAHSGILAIKNVSALPVKHIYNFYKTPVLYTQRHKGKIFNNFRGIKSATAEWAKNNLEKRNSNLVTALYSNEENIKKYIGLCDKVIYAIGFEPNKIIGIHENTGTCTYDETTGIIAPGLFGIGIAFPEGYTDPMGLWEHRVGLMSFVTYAKKMIPRWLQS